MSYVQIFTSSMFAIKNDGITSSPLPLQLSQVSFDPMTQNFSSSIVLVTQPVNHNYFLKVWITDDDFKGIKYSMVCAGQIAL